MMRKLGFAVLGILAGCASSEDGPLTWEEFRDQAYYEVDTGLYIVNGDEPVAGDDALREVYARYRDQYLGYGTTQQGLAVHQANGTDAKWNATNAVNLTYCIKKAGFLGIGGGFNAERYQLVKTALEGASGDWEGTARVNFIHLPAQDANCTPTNANVMFNVRQVNSLGQYVASAFFPDTPRAQRELKIDTTAFGNLAPWTLRGILRHELGHTIGFRHEHTRPESGTCFEDANWRALTTYDSASVMHYPQCNGTQTGDLVLTALDKQGARSLYP